MSKDKLKKDDFYKLGEEKSQLDGGGREETNQENRMNQKNGSKEKKIQLEERGINKGGKNRIKG